MATERVYLVDWSGAASESESTNAGVLADDGRQARVRVGEAELALETVALPDGSLLVTATDTATGATSRQVIVPLETAGGVELLSEGRSYVATVRAERDTWLRAGAGSSAGGGSVSVPMPGRVVKVLVAVGDRVEAGQALLIIEAMKMENEVKAAAAGTVRAVSVSEGLSVEAGQPLVELDVDADA